MIRVFRLFCKLNISIKELFLKFMAGFNPHEHKCPFCSARHPDWKKHGLYSRYIISFENGHTICHQINIIRYRCSSCGHTHAVLPDIIIPYQSYSLNFIIAVLQDYFSHSLTIAGICSKYDISVSTLYLWKKLFLKHKKLWLGALENMSASSVQFINSVINEYPVCILEDFFVSTGCSFLQGTFHMKKARSAPV